MADAGSSLRSYLLTKTALTAIVGQRIYFDVFPQSVTFPAIMMFRIDTRRDHTIGDCTRIAHALFEFNCWSSSRSTSDSISHAIRTCGITSYRGTTGDIWFNGIEINSGERHLVEPPTDGNQVHLYGTSFDLMVHYREAT